MSKVALWLKWFFGGYSERFYNEGQDPQAPEMWEALADTYTQKLSSDPFWKWVFWPLFRGRFCGYGGCHRHEHVCQICGTSYWSNAEESVVCKRWRCYRDYHVKGAEGCQPTSVSAG